MSKSYDSVLDLVQAILPDDRDYHKRLENYQAERNVSRALHVLRCAKRKTLTEVANKVGREARDIEKIEESANDKLSISDLAVFTHALDTNLQIHFVPKNATAVDSIKYLAFQIKKHLDNLADTVQDDETIEKGVRSFYEEFLFNMMHLSFVSLTKLQGQELDNQDLKHLAEEARGITENLLSKIEASSDLSEEGTLVIQPEFLDARSEKIGSLR